MSEQKIDPFTPARSVWVVDSDPVERDQLAKGLVPDIVNISSLNQFKEEFSDRLVGRDPNEASATMIVTPNVPINLTSGDNWDFFVNATNALIDNENLHYNLFIYDIREDQQTPFHDAEVVKDIASMIELAKSTHLKLIAGNGDVSEEARKAIDELSIDNERLRGKVDELNQFLIMAKKDMDKNQKKVEDLSNQIKDYDRRIEKANKTAEQESSENNAAQSKIEVLESQKDKYIIERDALNEKNSDLEIKIKALEETKNALTMDNKRYILLSGDQENEIQNLKDEISRLQTVKTENEAMTQVQDSKRAVEEKLKASQKDAAEAKAKNTVMENKIDALKQQLDGVRNGYKDISRVGYASEFQSFRIDSKIMYFKIIDSLQFHRFYINKMIDIMTSIDSDLDVVTVILKQDFGIDEELYPDYTLIGDLGDINDTNDKYLLIPSQNMGENAHKFDVKGKQLIVLDYIDNASYYIDSTNTIDIFTIVDDKNKMSKLGLKGKQISYDNDSMINLKYDTKIKAMTSQNQEQEYVRRLRNIIKQVAGRFANIDL